MAAAAVESAVARVLHPGCLSSEVEVHIPPLIRLAGISSQVLRELRFHEVGQAMEKHLELRRRLKAEGEQLSDGLYEVIGGLADDPAKPFLVGLRRALYQGRTPTAREWSPSTRKALGLELANRVEHWLDLHAQWRAGELDLDELIRSETGARAASLRHIASTPAFRRGLVQSSAALADDLDKWLADPDRAPRHRLAAALAKYLTRAAAKTSPFSTFMVTGPSTWTEDDVAVRQRADGLRGARGLLQLGHVTRADLHVALVTSERTRRGMIIRVNPSVVVVGDRLRFLGRPPEEPMVTIGSTPAIRACLDLLSEAADVTVGELVGRLAAKGNSEPSQVNAFLDRLVEVGLLQVTPHPGGQVTTPGATARWLQSLGEEFAHEGALVQTVSDYLSDDVPIDDVARHRSRLSGASHALASLARHLGQPIESSESLATFDAAVAEGPLAECGRSAWQPVLDDLQIIRRWLALFSSGLDLKIALDTWWTRKSSTDHRVPYLDFYHELMKEVASGSAAGEVIGGLWRSTAKWRESGSARADELHVLRDDAARMLWGEHDDDGVVSIEPGELAVAVARFPQWVDELHSLGMYGQPLMETAGPAFVVNNVFIGYGKGHRRMDGLMDRRAEPWVIPNDYPLFAGLGGSLGTSLNVREPCVPYEIVYPWHGDARPGVHELNLRDLWVERDHARGLLRLRAAGLDQEIKPLHLGLSAPWTLPRAAQLLVKGFGEDAPVPIAALAPRGHWSALPHSSLVPRARVGRVVVRRAHRRVAPQDIPAPRAGEREAAYLVRLAEWRHDSGIPETCFVKSLYNSRSPARVGEHKPLFIDFANPFLLLVFTDFLRLPHDAVLFEEALPDPMFASENYGGGHVMEMLMDVSAWDR
ncbi:lantibiotic dehydratase [Nonomuraea sp. SYSU D8015]|uniref:lantibiotic dehydratase n=1 Tax=Nonomuraea sp. SYSU D8015 TaxID=2593644 RepID=UPI0016605247|nr:lantibiotic dehydratase [Nonomuraea sp. SYSU D8015]